MKKYIITSLFLCLSLISKAQTEPSIEVKTDISNIKIGEQLTYTISVPNEKQVTFPRLDNLEGLEVAEELEEDVIKNRILKKYLITGFDSGSFYIKKQEVFIDAKAYFTDSLLVNVATIAVDTAQLNKYVNLKEAQKEEYTLEEITYRYEKYAYMLLGIIAFLTALFFLFRRKKEEKQIIVPKIPPYVTATKELKDLESKELWQNNKIKQYYSELTDIVRKYIGGELSIQGLETTTDELMDLLKVENKEQNLNLDKEFIERLKGLLSQADFVKFAKQKPLDSDIRGHQSDAKMVIETIHKIVESKKTEEKDEVQ